MPEELWIGINDLEWPIQAFGYASQAADWVGENPGSRHAFQVTGEILAEVLHIPPVARTHQVVPFTGAAGRADNA